MIQLGEFNWTIQFLCQPNGWIGTEALEQFGIMDSSGLFQHRHCAHPHYYCPSFFDVMIGQRYECSLDGAMGDGDQFYDSQLRLWQ